jgi:hypothetical protein
MREKRKSVQKNKVFIFIAVLHLGETGSLTKLNLSKGMTFTLQCEVTKQQLKMDSNASTPATQRREHTLLQNLD